MKALGEVDYTGHVKVIVPEHPDCKVWVRIEKGDRQSGRGIVIEDDVPSLKLGAVVDYDSDNRVSRRLKYPVVVRKPHVKNRREQLIKEVVQRLKDSMTFNPKRHA